MLNIKNPKVKCISLFWSCPIGRKASQSWWRPRWVLLPPQRPLAVIPPPLLAVPHCPTVCQLLSCYFSPLTSSSINNTQVLTFLSISSAQNQFLPHSVLSLVLWLWNRWCAGFFQHIFSLPIFLWRKYGKLTAYTVVYLVAILHPLIIWVILLAVLIIIFFFFYFITWSAVYCKFTNQEC